MRFAFNLNLPDERGDGVDGVRNREESDQRQARIRQTRMNTLADRPDVTFSGQSREGLDSIIGHNVVKLPHQSLIGAENDCAYRIRMGWCFPFHQGSYRLVFPKARTQPQFHGPIIIVQRAHRFLILSDARCGQGFHRADNGLEIAGTADLSAQALRGVAHDLSLASAVSPVGTSGLDPPSGSALALDCNADLDSGLGLALDAGSGFGPAVASGFGVASASGLGWKGVSAWRAISMIVLRSSSLNLSALSNRAHTSAGMFAAAFWTACSASGIWSSATRSKSSAVNASNTAICAGTDTGAHSACLRQARMRRPCSMILRVFSSSRAPNRAKLSSSSNCA